MSLASKIISYWKADETSGNLLDSVGVNTLTNQNSTPFAAGKINNAIDFEATNSNYFSISDASQSGLDLSSNYSISFWINPESFTADNFILGKYTVAGNQRSYLLYRNFGNGTINFVTSATGNSSIVDNGWVVSLSNGTWYHFVLSMNSGIATMYLNGVSLGITTGYATPFNSNAIFTIGQANGGNYVDGKLDEIAIFNTNLTSDEVLTLYANGLGNQLPFLPVLTTEAATDIGLTTATGNGTVLSDAGVTITERGLVWSTTSSPTILSSKIVVSGTTGSYSGLLSGLSANTLYYVRSYATNANGTSYGNEITFTTQAVALGTVVKDINGVEEQTYAVRLNVGPGTGTVTVSLGSTGTSQTFAAGAGVVTFQGIYRGLNGLTITSNSFTGYIDDVMWVLILGTATIDWSLTTLTNVYPINSSVLFRRIEDEEFNRFRIYRYLDVQFKDLDAYVTVLLKKEANENLTESSKQFLVSNASDSTLPFIDKRISTLLKAQAIRIGLSNNNLNETFTVCQLVIKGLDQPKKLFSPSKIISLS